MIAVKYLLILILLLSPVVSQAYSNYERFDAELRQIEFGKLWKEYEFKMGLRWVNTFQMISEKDLTALGLDARGNTKEDRDTPFSLHWIKDGRKLSRRDMKELKEKLVVDFYQNNEPIYLRDRDSLILISKKYKTLKWRYLPILLPAIDKNGHIDLRDLRKQYRKRDREINWGNARWFISMVLIWFGLIAWLLVRTCRTIIQSLDSVKEVRFGDVLAAAFLKNLFVFCLGSLMFLFHPLSFFQFILSLGIGIFAACFTIFMGHKSGSNPQLLGWYGFGAGLISVPHQWGQVFDIRYRSSAREYQISKT